VIYPRESKRLWEEVIANGGLVSEAPPGAPPEGWRFPLRNRIIAALSQVLVVIESSRQGGAMHTVLAADAYGVPVLAVPGSVRSPQSEGTNAVIQEGGAGVVLDVHDVLAALELECLEDGTPVSFSAVRPKDGRAKPVSTSWRSAPLRRATGTPATPPNYGAAGMPTPPSYGAAGMPATAGTEATPATPRSECAPGTPATPGKPWTPGTPERTAGAARAAAEAGGDRSAGNHAQQAMDFISRGSAGRRGGTVAREQRIARCTPTERAVLQAVDHTPTLLDLVCLRTKLDLETVALAVDRLDELGLVRSEGAGWIRL
jgi:predicted Rossmann fold nucleotide-binding protein DprA/Smf involved in DNA uptake